MKRWSFGNEGHSKERGRPFDFAGPPPRSYCTTHGQAGLLGLPPPTPELQHSTGQLEVLCFWVLGLGSALVFYILCPYSTYCTYNVHAGS